MRQDIIRYYRHPATLARILEFCGVPSRMMQGFYIDEGRSLADDEGLKRLAQAASAEYIAAYGARLLETNHKDHASMKPAHLGWALANALDIHRSVWDRDSVIGTLDVEYFSKNFPAEPYLAPERVFHLMEPWYQRILAVLNRYGFSPLILATGQGYNFDVGLPKDSPVFDDLVALGHIEPSLQYDYTHPSPKRGRQVPEADAKAFDATGKLFEFLFYRVASELPQAPPIPLVVGDIVCGNEKREAMSFDLSSYTNPLHKRSIRCAFSSYSKHWVKKGIAPQMAGKFEWPLFCVPRRTPAEELPLGRVLAIRGNPDSVIAWGREITAAIPDQRDGFASLMADYLKSPYRDFHLDYDAVKQDDPVDWPAGYDRLDLSALPPCVALPLRHPNPLLLQPTNLRMIVRALMALGWHPKHIAGLVLSKYRRDFSWEVDFRRYDADRWANGWVRVYAGMLISGIDRLRDLNCVSQKEKGYAWKGIRFCPECGCLFNLATYRDALKATLAKSR